MPLHRHSSTTTLLTALALLAWGASIGHAVGVKWLDAPGERPDWEAALERAKRTGEPVLAYVFVEHMQLCEMMEAQTFRNQQVGELSEKLLCVKVNVLDLDHQPFLEHYGVGRGDVQDTQGADAGRASMYPQTLFIAPDGAMAHAVFGFVGPEQFVNVIEASLEIVDLLDKVREDDQDAGALARLGGIYVELQRYDSGRKLLEQALQLDEAAVAETALLDMAVCDIDGGESDDALDRLRRHITDFPESDGRCKARYLVGGAHLAIMYRAQMKAEELDRVDDSAGAKAALKQATAARREAISAWEYFEAKDGPAPCEDSECEWSGYALGALKELRADDAYVPVAERLSALMEAEDYMGAVKQLRAYVKIEEHLGTEASCGAEYLIGECLLRAGKPAEAVKQWRNLANRGEDRPCGASQWRAEALQALAGAGGE